jgi:FHA domain
VIEPALDALKAAADCEREQFAKRYPHPVLLVEPFQELDDTGFNTNVAKGNRGVTLMLATVRKEVGANPFASMITIGRAGRNDISLKADGVSKFHAYLTPEGHEMFVTDAGSSFGTTVDGKRIVPRTKHPVRDGAAITFGGVEAHYYLPPSLYDRLRLELGRRGRRHGEATA